MSKKFLTILIFIVMLCAAISLQVFAFSSPVVSATIKSMDPPIIRIQANADLDAAQILVIGVYDQSKKLIYVKSLSSAISTDFDVPVQKGDYIVKSFYWSDKLKPLSACTLAALSLNLENFAANKSYFASSSEGANVIPNAFDSNLETRWSSNFTDAAGSYIGVDFGSRVTVNSLVINECKIWAHATGFIVQANNNGSWVDLYEGGEIINGETVFFDETTTDKLRLYFTGSSAGDSPFATVTIYEFAIYMQTAPPPVNLALNKTYFASTTEGSNITPLAFDGNLETRWSSYFGDAAGSYIGVDFGSAVTFNSIVIQECKDWGHATGFKVQKYENDNWVDVYTGTEIVNGSTIFFNETTTNKLRLYFTSSVAATVGFETITIFEFEVYKQKAPPLINLAANKTYFASSSEAAGSPSELSPSFAFDANLESRWGSVFKDAAGSFIGVDFGNAVTFNSIVIQECKEWGHATGFIIQKYENDNWVDVYEGGEIVNGSTIYFPETTTNKMRLYFTGVDCGMPEYATVTIYEIEVYKQTMKPTENLALNKTYFASSSEAAGTPSELSPSFAFDGDEATRWSSVFADAAGSFIGVDFGSATTFNSVVINECKNWGQATGYKVQKYENNVWVDIYEGDGIVDGKAIYFSQTTTRKMRILFTGIENGNPAFATATIYEIGVFFDPFGAPPSISETGWFEFPLTNAQDASGEYLYLVGGYNTFDNGCPAWGTNNPAQALYIGDEAGAVNIVYQDNTTASIPLIFGYTMWFHQNWMDGGAPFKTSAQDAGLTSLLKETLYLQGAYEGEANPILKIKIANKAIKSIKIADNASKKGTPIFKGGYLVANDSATSLTGGTNIQPNQAFFSTHTIDASNAGANASNITALQRATLTFEDDYLTAPNFSYPANYSGTKIQFSGNQYAQIATGVIYNNLKNLEDRTDDDGFIHTSYLNAPSWRYDGFGTWVPNANSYYDCFYSRDCSRAIMTLSSYGKTTKAEKGINFANKWLMYYPENNLKIAGKSIPGHWSVIINKPLVYSTALTAVGWPTQYTYERFGEGYQNIGNQETDGHGLSMMATYKVWKNLGANASWVNTNWTYINEAASWLAWCFENPDVSFVKNGLLYSESEAGMNDYTLYSNMPCYFGLRMYAEMAQSVGKTAEANLWNGYADSLYNAINANFVEDNCWKLSKVGFYYDPTPTMYSDFAGYDIGKYMPANWLIYSKNAYAKHLASDKLGGTYFGATGLGYDHSMITQNALLLDKTDDSNKFVTNLSKICYSPRLPEPYLVPEGISVDVTRGILRRQGDLANLVQLSEALKCYQIIAGISPVENNELNILPRLPKDWTMNVQNFDVINSDATINVQVSYPNQNNQTLVLTKPTGSVGKINVRMGPFTNQNISFTLNNSTISPSVFQSGDSYWAYVTINAPTQETYTITAH